MLRQPETYYYYQTKYIYSYYSNFLPTSFELCVDECQYVCEFHRGYHHANLDGSVLSPITSFCGESTLEAAKRKFPSPEEAHQGRHGDTVGTTKSKTYLQQQR